MVSSDYPFTDFFKWYLQIEDLFEGMSTQQEIRDRKDELWQILQGIFSDLKEVMPYENLRDEQERIKFRLCTSQNTLFALTINYLAKQYEELKDIGFTFDTLIIDQGVSNVDILSCFCIDDKIKKVLIFQNTDFLL
jgi:hypothetical protein